MSQNRGEWNSLWIGSTSRTKTGLSTPGKEENLWSQYRQSMMTMHMMMDSGSPLSSLTTLGIIWDLEMMTGLPYLIISQPQERESSTPRHPPERQSNSTQL